MNFGVTHTGVWVRRSSFRPVEGMWSRVYVHIHQTERPMILEEGPPFYEERDSRGRPIRQEYRSCSKGVAVYEYAYGRKGDRILSETTDPPHLGVV